MEPIHISELVPLTRKRVHCCFLVWRRYAKIMTLRTRIAARSNSLKRGLAALRAIVKLKHALYLYQRCLKARVFRMWHFISAEAPNLPLRSGLQVLFCFKLIAHSLSGDHPTYQFPWKAIGSSTEGGISVKSTSRFRSYVLGCLDLPTKNLPLFVHAMAVLDALQLRKSFETWKAFHDTVRLLRQRPCRMAFINWRRFAKGTTKHKQLTLIVKEKAALNNISSYFRKWRTTLKYVRCNRSLSALRARSSLLHWRELTVQNAHLMTAFRIVKPHFQRKTMAVAFNAWMIVWLQRLRLQRISNRVVCRHFESLLRSSWADWRGSYIANKTYRHSSRDLWRELTVVIKTKRRETQHLTDRAVKKIYLTWWKTLYSYRVRGQYVASTWRNHHRRRKMLWALRQWILLCSVETIATCVQKSWRGYYIRFIRYADTWARVKWLRHYLGQCARIRRTNAKKRILRTWRAFIREQGESQTLECQGANKKATFRLFMNKVDLVSRQRANTRDCQQLYNLTSLRHAMTLLDFSVVIKYKLKLQDRINSSAMGLLYQQRVMESLRRHISNRAIRRQRRLVVRRLWFKTIVKNMRNSMYQKRILDAAQQQHIHNTILLWKLLTKDRISFQQSQRAVLLRGLGKAPLYQWVLFRLGRRLSRGPGNTKRLIDIRRTIAVLRDRADIRREQYLCRGSLSEVFVFSRNTSLKKRHQRCLSGDNGLKYCYLRKWFLRVKTDKTYISLNRYYVMLHRTKIIQLFMNRWKSVGFSQSRWRRLASRHYNVHMRIWKVRAAFIELRRPLDLRYRIVHTLAVKRLLLGMARLLGVWKAKYFARAAQKVQIGLSVVHYTKKVKSVAFRVLKCRAIGVPISSRWEKAWAQGSPLRNERSTFLFTNGNVSRGLSKDSVRPQDRSRMDEFVFKQSPTPSNSWRQSSYRWYDKNPDVDHFSRRSVDLEYGNTFVDSFYFDSTSKSQMYRSVFKSVRRNIANSVVPIHKSSQLLHQFKTRIEKAKSHNYSIPRAIPFTSLSSQIWRSSLINSKHIADIDIARYSCCRKLMRGMRTLYRHALCKISLRHSVWRTIAGPAFKFWSKIYKEKLHFRLELEKITVRIMRRLVKGIFMAWAFHTMQCRRLAIQFNCVLNRNHSWVLRRGLNHWIHLMAWDRYSRSFLAVMERRIAKQLKRSFSAWRRARLVVGSLNDALCQLVFTGWIWYVRGKKIKSNAVLRATAYFRSIKQRDFLNHWSALLRQKKKSKSMIVRGEDHYASRIVWKSLLYWLSKAWWLGRFVLYTRRRLISRSNFAHRNFAHRNFELNEGLKFGESFGKSMLSPLKRDTSFTHNFKTPEIELFSSLSPIRADLNGSKKRVQNVSFILSDAIHDGRYKQFKHLPVASLCRKGIPWSSSRIFGNKGKRHVPGLIESSLRRVVRHWVRISRSRKLLWEVQIRRRLFNSWRRDTFRLKNLRIAFLSRLENSWMNFVLERCFDLIKKEAKCSKLKRKMTAYFRLQKLQITLNTWRRQRLIRVKIREKLQSVFSAVEKVHRNGTTQKKIECFKFWKVSVLFSYHLDLFSLGRTVFLNWRALLLANRFRSMQLTRTAFKAWSLRLQNLSKIRNRVLDIRKACSILETRARNIRHIALSTRFNTWAGRSSRSLRRADISVTAEFQREINKTRPLYLNKKDQPATPSKAADLNKNKSSKNLVAFPRQRHRESSGYY